MVGEGDHAVQEVKKNRVGHVTVGGRGSRGPRGEKKYHVGHI